MKLALIIEIPVPFCTIVEADTLEECVRIAKERGVRELCEACTKDSDEEWVCAPDVEGVRAEDGVLTDLHVVDGYEGPQWEFFDKVEKAWKQEP